jgi:hypothetical protein
MYTTTNNNKCELNPRLWRGIRKCAMRKFDGSTRLFNACWHQYRSYVKGAIDDPTCLADVTDWLDTLASEKVNNSRSSFYIYG